MRRTRRRRRKRPELVIARSAGWLATLTRSPVQLYTPLLSTASPPCSQQSPTAKIPKPKKPVGNVARTSSTVNRQTRLQTRCLRIRIAFSLKRRQPAQQWNSSNEREREKTLRLKQHSEERRPNFVLFVLTSEADDGIWTEFYTVFHKKDPFFHNLLKLLAIYIEFLPVVAEEILIRNIWTKYDRSTDLAEIRQVHFWGPLTHFIREGCYTTPTKGEGGSMGVEPPSPAETCNYKLQTNRRSYAATWRTQTRKAIPLFSKLL